MSAAERSGYFTRPSKASVAFAEERAWIGFYHRIGDSAVAEEVIQYLDANPDERHQHPALYPCICLLRDRCAETSSGSAVRNASEVPCDLLSALL